MALVPALNVTLSHTYGHGPLNDDALREHEVIRQALEHAFSIRRRVLAAAGAERVQGIRLDSTGQAIEISGVLAEFLIDQGFWEAEQRFTTKNEAFMAWFARELRSIDSWSLFETPKPFRCRAVGCEIEFKLRFSANNGEIAVEPKLISQPSSALVKCLLKESQVTDAGADVATSLLTEPNLDAVAMQRGTAVTTVRTQLKSVLAKTNTHRQRALIELVRGLVDRFR